MKKDKLIVIWLCLIWAISFFSFGIFVPGLFADQSQHPIIFSSYRFALMTAVIVYFCPFLIVIQHYAKKAEIKSILVISRFLIFQHLLWFVLALLEECGK